MSDEVRTGQTAPLGATGTKTVVKRKSTLREYAEAIIVAVILTVFIRSFVFQAFRIPTGSMEDTLLVGDFLFVNKFLYGAHIPFTDARLPAVREPRHGDIVVFKFPRDPSRDFIKRLVGEPGDTLQIKDKVVYVNGDRADGTLRALLELPHRADHLQAAQHLSPGSGEPRQLRAGGRAARALLHDGRQPGQLGRQPLLGLPRQEAHQGEGHLHLLVLEQGEGAPEAGAHRGSDPLTGIPLRTSGAPVAGLYVHVPFCRAMCSYCAFAKGEYDAGRAEAWLAGLVAEIAHRARDTWSGRPAVDTVFLGGGTPSALAPRQWARLGDILRAGFTILPEAEFTSEANPESFTPEIAAAMRGAGVNRVSLGVQSFDANELRMLDRIHGAAEVERAVRTARDAGFDNFNLDLMYGLPGQDVETFAASLERVIALNPEHLSAYCLGLEPGTALAASVSAGTLPRPDDDVARAQYDVLVTQTEAAGLVALRDLQLRARGSRMPAQSQVLATRGLHGGGTLGARARRQPPLGEPGHARNVGRRLRSGGARSGSATGSPRRGTLRVGLPSSSPRRGIRGGGVRGGLGRIDRLRRSARRRPA